MKKNKKNKTTKSLNDVDNIMITKPKASEPNDKPPETITETYDDPLKDKDFDYLLNHYN